MKRRSINGGDDMTKEEKDKLDTLKKFLSLPERERRMVIARASPELAQMMDLLDRVDENIATVYVSLRNIKSYQTQIEGAILSIHSAMKGEIKNLEEGKEEDKEALQQ